MDSSNGPSLEQDDTIDEAERIGRAKQRESVFLMARFWIDPKEDGWDVRIRNLSEGGLMVEIPTMVDVGTPVTLFLRGVGRVTGRIAWYAEGRAGVSLDYRIDPAAARKPVGQGTKTPIYARPATV